MPSTRRRFLLGAAAIAGVAGCNERSPRAQEGTVTPVEVPRTDHEYVREAVAIDAPTLPPATRVSEAHWSAAVGHVESLQDSIREQVDSVDGSAEKYTHQRPPERVLEEADDRLEEAREAGPSESGLDTLHRVVNDLARADGFLRAEHGSLDADALRDEVEAERARADALVDSIEYRIADPIEDVLPTAVAAERTLDAADGLRNVDRFLDAADADEETRPERLATVYRYLEGHRRRRDDAERYLETATDPNAPSLRSAIDAELDALEEELARVAGRFPEGDRESLDDESVRDYFEGIRRSVGRRTGRFHARISEHRRDGRRLLGLFEAVRLLVEYGSIEAAIDRTVPLLDEPEFPASRLVAEKRRTVESIERVADGTPVQRHLAGRAPQLLESADRFSGAEEADTRSVAQMHLLYVGAARWAERGLERGDALSESLQAQQS